MSNQIVNPLIQSCPEETLGACKCVLDYVCDAIDVEQDYLCTAKSQYGLFLILDSVRQAVEFESIRTEDLEIYKSRFAPNFELSLIKTLQKHLRPIMEEPEDQEEEKPHKASVSDDTTKH